MGRKENMNTKFYYKNGQYYLSVRVPVEYKPTIYMCCGNDNRPLYAIEREIETAMEMLNECGYVRAVDYIVELPKLLGYNRCSPSLS